METMRFIIFLYLCTHSLYTHTIPLIDVVIPCTEKDLPTLEHCINGIRTYGKNINRIIVVSRTKLTDTAEWFDESLYPFSFSDIALQIFNSKPYAEYYLAQKANRIGWIFQQLLKLYSPFIIPDISENILVLDADTVFLHPVEFIDNEGYALYNPGTEYHKPYFEHATKLIPHFTKIYPHYSGISHHMLLQRNIMRDLFDVVETHHKKSFWKAFCNCINLEPLDRSCASEYEIYFNFIFSHAYPVKIRTLRWTNASRAFLTRRINHESYDYISFHSYL